jgi:glycosyltransferase involved in cell wall biosynthesis
MNDVRISVCTTNYNCDHALDRHLDSVYHALSGLHFEYIVVDNRSADRSWEILRTWEASHPNMTVLSRRCTMGEGRQIAFRRSSGSHVVVLDTDVVYSALLRRFVDAYFAECPRVSVQAIFCGIFPRGDWVRAGGRRSLNTNEDADMWIRLLGMATMRWYPVYLGTNLKEPEALGRADHLSHRYGRWERVLRLIRREWDLLKTREIEELDLQKTILANRIDLGIGPNMGDWPQKRTISTPTEHVIELAMDLKRALRMP